MHQTHLRVSVIVIMHMAIEILAFLFRIREVRWRSTIRCEVFVVLVSLSKQMPAITEQPQIRSRPLPSMSFSTYNLIIVRTFYVIQPEILKRYLFNTAHINK